MIKHKRSKSFYESFDRKKGMPQTTHYCPGCGHGIAHKLIARAIDDLNIQDRVIMCSPVGCSVFLYYYFDTGNVQCAHGRAPAVATGMRRALEDAIIVCYQGDGDLAGIGTAEIIHAANRNENLTVFFINNAIYGMTGGQMAPTTLVGQKTITTPEGRSLLQDGGPIGMAEVMAALKTPVYIERVSLASAAKISHAQKSVKKALANQVDKKGFSFVEILSPCPTGWKMDPLEALEWIENSLEKEFPCRIFRDVSSSAPALQEYASVRPWLDDDGLRALLQSGEKGHATPPQSPLPHEQKVKISGFGGQGILSAGVLLTECAAAEGRNATCLPSYGAEMRGGTASASTIISMEDIGSPVVDTPNVLIAMNGPSLDAFEKDVEPGGVILVNSSLVSRTLSRADVRAVYIPASELAKEEGLLAGATVLMLMMYALTTRAISPETLRAILPQSIRKKALIPSNLRILDRAARYHREHLTER
ncbi:MAG: 2-oxoacid:acceptor oxidoreductase family protein [Chitinispirillaceae bacterium]|nr:2-oxoacid:acceptor oxidoreductase family protein [Chitinispirillaceae bacterium]